MEILPKLVRLANKLDEKGFSKEADVLDALVKIAGEEHGGKPDKVVEIAKAVHRENPDMSDEDAYKIAWSQYKEGKSNQKVTHAKENGKPDKVVEIADAIRRDNPDTSDAVAYAQAWETYCSYVNPSYEGCTSKGKSKRKSPKSDYIDE